MSDKIYFSTSNKFNMKKRMVNVITRLHHRLAPKHAEKTATRLFLTPMRMTPKNPEPTGMIVRDLASSEGSLKTYQLGTGPVWVLTHGWSGSANQFFPLMEHIASRGFTALAYDHPGHGQSEGSVGHIPAFVNGLNAVLDSVGDLAGLIGHSMGTAAAIESQHPQLQDKPLLLIAPVLNYLDNLLGTVSRSGYSMRLFRAVVSKVEDKYQYPLETVDPFNKLKKRSSRVTIVHDINDRFARFDVSEKAAAEAEHVTLTATKGQGHGRVMKCYQTLNAFDALADIH